MKIIRTLTSVLLLFFIMSFGYQSVRHSQNSGEQASSISADSSKYPIHKTKEEWKQLLSWREYRVLRKGGTEIPFVNEYNDNTKEGIYYCKACGQPLYTSATKYDSGTGWPSFWEPISLSYVEKKADNSLFMERTEIVCARCGSHIGHVFKDGPEPTGFRYCMNSHALDFVAADLDSLNPNQIAINSK